VSNDLVWYGGAVEGLAAARIMHALAAAEPCPFQPSVHQGQLGLLQPGEAEDDMGAGGRGGGVQGPSRLSWGKGGRGRRGLHCVGGWGMLGGSGLVPDGMVGGVPRSDRGLSLHCALPRCTSQALVRSVPSSAHWSHLACQVCG